MQTWTNLLNYIKRNTGAKLNLLEMDDDEIIEGITDDVIPLFSQYSSFKKYCIINGDNLVPFITNSRDNQWKYELPITINEYVIDIDAVYIDTGSTDDPFYNTKYSNGNTSSSLSNYGRGSTGVYGGGMIDTVINNEFLDMLNSLGKKITWEFTPPKTIRVDGQVNTAVVVYCTNHEDLNTISPDFYNIIFKPLSFGYVLKWISALRSKYETLASPMGEIRVNWSKLEQESEKLITEANEKMENIVPDHFLEIV
jgi:hypothetical protein